MRRPAKSALTAALAALAAACAGPRESRPAADPVTGAPPMAQATPLTADDYFAARDWERAALEYDRAAAAAPGDAALAEKARTAKRLAAQEHAVAAANAAERGDFARAAYELAKAEGFDASAEPVRRVRAAIGPKLEAAQSIESEKGLARELLATDAAAAIERLTALRRRAPGDPDVVEMLTEATRRVEADRAAARAAEAWEAGVRRRAVEHLAAAEFAGRPVASAAALRRRMENDLVAESSSATLPALRDAWSLAKDARLSPGVADTLRERMVASLLREARTHEAAGRFAVAALYETEAQRAGGPAASKNLDRVRSERGITVHVLPFEDATGGSVDGARLARAVRDRLAIDAFSGTATILASGDAPAVAGFPHLVLTGRAERRKVATVRVGAETVRAKYVTGTRSAASAAVAELNRDLTAARTRLTAAADRLTSAETLLRELQQLDFGRGPGGRVGSRGDVAYQTKIAAAKAAADGARRDVERAHSDEFAVRQQLLATPSTVSEPVWAEATYEAVTWSSTAEIAATLRLADGDTPLLDAQIVGSDVHREVVSPGFPAGGIAPDPDETPDAAALSVRADAAFADAASARVREAAESAARRLLVDAREAERRGDPAAAAESYAVYLLTTTETATPERSDAARAIREILRLTTSLRTGFVPGSDR